jgi:hypothetical protein
MLRSGDLIRLAALPTVRKRVEREARSRADELRTYINASDKFVSGIVRKLGPWAALWWLDELSAVLACKALNKARGKKDDPVLFLRWKFHRPHTIVLSSDAAKRPKLKDEERETIDVLCAVTSRMDDVGKGTVVQNLDDEKFMLVVRAVVAEHWDETEMKVLRTWLRPTVRAAKKKKDERERKTTAAREAIRWNLPFPEQMTPWEKKFIDELLRRGRMPTEKQAAMIERMKAERGRVTQGFG